MRRSSTVLSVVSGKGGVGKSVVSVNLAETLARDGFRVALLDADAGQSACEVLLNEMPGPSIADVASGYASIADACRRTSTGITLVEIAKEERELPTDVDRLMPVVDATLDTLSRRHEFVIVDAPAGIDGMVRWALDRADLGAVVIVDEPTAIADAYRLVKLAWSYDVELPLGAVVNFCESEQEARGVAERFGIITRRFTGAAPLYLGWVPFSPQVRTSVREQCPVVRHAGPVRASFEGIAAALVEGESASEGTAGRFLAGG